MSDDYPLRREWRPNRVSTHDHVGHMTYGWNTARCSVCGQRWSYEQRRIVAEEYEGDHPAATRRR